MSNTSNDIPQYTKKDFASDAEVRWCPGCGDYSVLAAMQMACAELGRKREDIVFVSGIGCSSRFPYYMKTYGMHTIHGRAPAVATGVKIQNPELSVWVATGDGDALSIGGNHFIHAVRRNIDLNIIIFNNEIYGLTKGQYSPTSKTGLVTKSSPYGCIDHPFSAAALSLGSGTTFFARTHDGDLKHMKEMFKRADAHKGVSVVEVLQNCVIFNDGTHDDITGKEIKEDHSLKLEHGQPMIFGKNKDKGIIVDEAIPRVVTIDDSNRNRLLIHDEKSVSPFVAHLLSSFHLPELPIPMGVFRDISLLSYDEALVNQIDDVTTKKGKGDMQKLLSSGDTWEIQ